jgi:hypothetical protein
MDRTANHLASYGRHGDDTLLHVSRAELAGIRQLTGKGFTTNPHTGLPEAFNWAKVILPAIAGIAATALTGGAAAPFVGAAASGLTTFGVGKAQGESTSQALGEGIIGGLTSYAGGQLLNGIGSAASGTVPSAAVAETASGQIAGTALPGEPGMFVGGGAAPNATSAADAVYSNYLSSTGPSSAVATDGSVIPLPPNPPANPDAASMTGNPYFQNAAGGQPIGPVTAVTPVQQPSISNSFSSLGNRISNVASNPGEAISQLGKNIADKPMSALIAGAGLYGSLTSPTSQPKIPGQTPYDPAAHPPKFPDQQPRWIPEPAGYVPGVSPERRYFAKGGIASMRGEDGMTANVVYEAKAALLNEHPRPREALARFESMFGSDALSLMRDRLTGGRVRGAGGGMDDLIPGDIEGRQRVRLADGEFVIPADVVSGLGDGSTDHGVRRLHEMMNSVRKQRTGKEAQPKSIGGKINL